MGQLAWSPPRQFCPGCLSVCLRVREADGGSQDIEHDPPQLTTIIVVQLSGTLPEG